MTALDDQKKSLNDLISQLRTASSNTPSLADPKAAEVFNRFVQVLAFLEQWLDKLDLALAGSNKLNQLSAQLNSLLATFNNFLQHASQWQPLINLTDQLLSLVATIPTAAPDYAAAQYTTALDHFLRQKDQAIKLTEDRVAKMEDRVKSLEQTANLADARAKEIGSQVDQAKSRLDNLISESQGRISKLIQEEETRHREAENKRVQAVNDREAKREKDSMAKLQELTAEFDKIATANKQSFSNLITTKQKEADECVTGLRSQLAEAIKIVGLIANTGMAGHYQKAANVDWWSMWLLRGVAGGFFLGAIGAIYTLIHIVHTAQIDWQMVVFRFALVAVVLVPAFYFARESGRHMQSEARNRRIELELSALQPFIARLPEAEAQAVIKKKADQYFANEPPPDQDDHYLLKSISLRGDQVLKIITKLAAIWRSQ